MNSVANLKLFHRFYLEYPQLLPGINSDAVRRESVRSANSETVSRNLGASVDALVIHHALLDESWHPGILQAKGAS